MKNGVSLIALLATVVIMILILSAAVVTYGSIINNTMKSEFAREMYVLRKLVLEYEFKNNVFPIDEEININLDNIREGYKEQFSEELGYDTNNITLYKINYVKAGVDNISRGLGKSGLDDIYVFSTHTKKIYYVKGQSVGNSMYYTLTDELYKILNITDL